MAVIALSAGVNHAPYPYSIADGILGDFRTNLSDNPGDFVTWNERIFYRSPLAASSMNVGVANTGVLYLNENIMRLKVSTLNSSKLEGTI
jgi:hypothetical protein